MKVVTPEISWHERDPIYTIDIQPGSRNGTHRVATGGGDKAVRLWLVKVGEEKVDIDFLSTLSRHSLGVNIVRFSPSGEVLASAGDDGVIVLWKQSEVPTQGNIFQEDEEENKEVWSCVKILRGHLEDIYDLSWSADGNFLISGSVDSSAIMWDVNKPDSKLALLKDHKGFVQGVAWDPLNEYVATLGTDRSCRIYNINSKCCVYNVCKMTLPSAEPTPEKPKAIRMFHDDTMKSFFRRLTFTPDGQLLIVPSGCLERGEGIVNATYIFTRGCLNKPAVYLPSPQKATRAVRVCPQLFELRKKKLPEAQDSSNSNEDSADKYPSMFSLPYRLVFAVATEDALQLYDTQQTMPIGVISNIHYTQLSDLSWSANGRVLIVSSTDGFCTIITFQPGELGSPYCPKETTSQVEMTDNDQKKMEVSENAAEIMANLKVSDPASTQGSPKVSSPGVKASGKSNSPGVKVTPKRKSPGVKGKSRTPGSEGKGPSPKVKTDDARQSGSKKTGKDGKKSPSAAKGAAKKGKDSSEKNPAMAEDSCDSDVMFVSQEPSSSSSSSSQQLQAKDPSNSDKKADDNLPSADDKKPAASADAGKTGEEPMDTEEDDALPQSQGTSPSQVDAAEQKPSAAAAAAADKGRRIRINTLQLYK